MYLSATQIKAARAMVDWSQEDLAAATNLSKATICKVEQGMFSRHETNMIICRAFTNIGIEFIEGEGVRRRNEDFGIFGGSTGCEKFFNDILHSVKEKGGDIVCMITSPEMMMLSCGMTNRDGVKQMEQLSAIASVKCLVPGTCDPSLLPSFQFRATPKLQIPPAPFYVYGNKCAFAVIDSGVDFKFMVVKDAGWAQVWRERFYMLWEDAVPLAAQTQGDIKRRV